MGKYLTLNMKSLDTLDIKPQSAMKATSLEPVDLIKEFIYNPQERVTAILVDDTRIWFRLANVESIVERESNDEED